MSSDVTKNKEHLSHIHRHCHGSKIKTKFQQQIRSQKTAEIPIQNLLFKITDKLKMEMQLKFRPNNAN